MVKIFFRNFSLLVYRGNLCTIGPQTPSCLQVCVSDWYDCLVSVVLYSYMALTLQLSFCGECTVCTVPESTPHEENYESH